MGRPAQTPFDNIESSHEYVSMLSDAVRQAIADVEADITEAEAAAAGRRKDALQLVRYRLSRLEDHMTSSRRILNDLRTLRRLLLDERSLQKVVTQAAAATAGATAGKR